MPRFSASIGESLLGRVLLDRFFFLVLWLGGSCGLLSTGCGGEQPPAAPGVTPTQTRGVTVEPATKLPAPDPVRHRAELPPPRDLQTAEVVRGEACIRCHLPPPADALPRENWAEQILVMSQLPVPSDVAPLTRQELADAIAWYEANAPETWPLPAAESPPVSSRFTARSYSPEPLLEERIPAASFLAWDPEGRGLLVAEMRSGTILLLPVGAQEVTDLDLAEPIRWNYPVHISTADLNGDGRLDRIVAGLGGMNPTDELRGGVQILYGGESRARPIGQRVARASDAEAADLDGDGDLDLVVCAFGWRGGGELLFWERVADQWRFHTIDERDGFVHVETADIDRDGDVDLITAVAQESEEVIIFRNDGGAPPAWTPIVIDRAPHPGWGISGLEWVDLDRDGDRDLLVSHGDSLDVGVMKPYHGVSWLRNDGDFRFTRQSIGSLPGCERAIARDFDRDGDLDVIAVAFLPQLDPDRWALDRAESVVIFKQVDDGWRRITVEVGNPFHPSVEAGDLDGDGDFEIAVGNYVWIDEGQGPRQRRDVLTVFYQNPNVRDAKDD